MLVDRLLVFANHLLGSEAWACARLKPFAGQTARLEIGPLSLPLTIDRSGRLTRGDHRAPASVSIRLPDDTPLRWLTDRESVFAAARISGPADFAETLAFVFRNLRWDAEADLAGFIGDIAARRLLGGVRSFVTWQGRRLHNLAVNTMEFLTEEQPTLARTTDLAQFSLDVDALSADCSRLERRLQKIA